MQTRIATERQGEGAGLMLDRLSVGGALKEVSLAVPPGRMLAVLGGPGAGKTALMNALAGFTAVPHGRTAWNGSDLSRLAPDRRGFGYVAQHDALFAHLTLADNIAYPLHLRGTPRREVRRMVDAALESVLLDRAGRLPAQVSAAERQRAWIARATIFGPAVLLLDEPLAYQEQEQRGAVLAALRRLHLLLGATAILATRVAADALALSDEIAILDAGSIVQTGAADSLYDRPRSAAAALACGEANLLPGTVQDIDEDGIARVGLRSGPVVLGTASADLRVRDRCLVCIRPERIALAPVAASEMGEAAFDATVLEALHLGDALRVRVLLGTGEEVLVKRPAAAGTRGLRARQDVAIAWQMGNAVVFPVGGGAGPAG